jgi:dihydrodipicolinate synthase/N-acetylneuraminate lyase
VNIRRTQVVIATEILAVTADEDADMPRRPEVLTATVTPFDTGGDVDLGAFRAILQHVAGQVDGVFVAGTTGEFPALTAAERAALVAQAVTELSAERVVAHVGAPSLWQAQRLLRDAADAGAHRFAAITPYYLTVSAAGVRSYFAGLRAAADRVVMPGGGRAELYVYIYPDVANTDVSAAELADLAALGADGVKISGAASRRVREYAAVIGPHFRLWSGNDAGMAQVAALGGTGLVSGCSGVVPTAWRALADKVVTADRGDPANPDRAEPDPMNPDRTEPDPMKTDEAESDQTDGQVEQEVVRQLVDALGASIAHVKYALALLGLPGGATRMPIDPPSPKDQWQIRAALAAAGQAVAGQAAAGQAAAGQAAAGQATSAATARPAMRPENRQPPRNVPSSAR